MILINRWTDEDNGVNLDVMEMGDRLVFVVDGREAEIYGNEAVEIANMIMEWNENRRVESNEDED